MSAAAAATEAPIGGAARPATRVGVNLLWLVPGVVGGSEEYLVRSLLALAAAAPADLDVTVFGLDALADAHPELAAAFPIVTAPLRGRSKGLRVVAETSWLAAEVRRRRLDVVHHGGGVVPFLHPGRTVVTIHDLQPLAFPERFGPLKRRYLAAMLPRSARAADVIVTSTAFVRDCVVERLGADPRRCRIVPPCLSLRLPRPGGGGAFAEPLGPAPAPAGDDGPGGPADVADVRRHHGIGERYFLYPAITYAHKDHAVLADALARLDGPAEADIELVLTGGAGEAEEALAERVRRLGLGARVHRLGRVPRGELDALLTGALALLFPSRYEGFGLPVLEAMSAGVPVAVADATALVEVVGCAGLRLAPGEPSAWAEAMADLARRGDLRARLAAAGRAHAADFGPAPTAHALAEAYRAAGAVGHWDGPAMNITVVCPHFSPDIAPTGEVMTTIAHGLVDLGHRLHVITALPWYRHHAIEEGWGGRPVRHEQTSWGGITRVHPFPTDKTNIPARALAFGGFTGLAVGAGLVARRQYRPDVVAAMSPPLTLGPAAWLLARRWRVPMVFNVQDVFPDVAVELGVLRGERAIALARALERFVYRRADAVTVLSDELAANVAGKLPAGEERAKVHVIPNFVDTEVISVGPKENGYRAHYGLGGRTVVMYAGNVGLSQSLGLLLHAARALVDRRPDITFVINGGGSARAGLEADAAGLDNVAFIDYQPKEMLGEVLGAADVHVVPLRTGLAHSSVPSKLYSVLAAGRPVLASVDAGTEVARTIERAGAGVAVAPDDPDAFLEGLLELLAEPVRLDQFGAAGRRFVEAWASPAAVAEAYSDLFAHLVKARDRG